MTQVTFGKYNFRIEPQNGTDYIFDEARKKLVPLTPEEWVRQHVLHYLIYDKQFPKSLIAVERGIELNGLQKRFDVVVFGSNGQPKIIVECKAPEEKLDDKVFQQIAAYNLSLRVGYLWVTNGAHNYCCQLQPTLTLLDEVPDYEAVNRQ